MNFWKCLFNNNSRKSKLALALQIALWNRVGKNKNYSTKKEFDDLCLKFTKEHNGRYPRNPPPSYSSVLLVIAYQETNKDCKILAYRQASRRCCTVHYKKALWNQVRSINFFVVKKVLEGILDVQCCAIEMLPILVNNYYGTIPLWSTEWKGNASHPVLGKCFWAKRFE